MTSCSSRWKSAMKAFVPSMMRGTKTCRRASVWPGLHDLRPGAITAAAGARLRDRLHGRYQPTSCPAGKPAARNAKASTMIPWRDNVRRWRVGGAYVLPPTLRPGVRCISSHSSPALQAQAADTARGTEFAQTCGERPVVLASGLEEGTKAQDGATSADGGETDAMAAGISKEAGGSDQPPAEAALPEPPGTSEEPTFLENVFGDCASYPNVLWAQELLGAVHVSTGLPWWATIVVTTLAARSLMLPLAFYQQKIAAHLQAATPELRAVEEEYQLAKTVYKDPGAEKRRKTKLEAIYATHHNCRPWKLFAYMGAQGPLFLTFFFGIKALARMYPDVTDGGLLWARNLAVPDPMHLLPIAAAATMLTTLEVNLRARQHLMQPMQYKMQLGVQRIVCLSAVPLLVGLKYPAGVFIYWVVNNLFSSVQVAVLQNSAVRQQLGLPALAPVQSAVSAEDIKKHIDRAFPPHAR